MKPIKTSCVAAACVAVFINGANAAVSAAEAAKLGTELTPFGAERAGNKEGTIPAWTGGHTTPIPNEANGSRGDPFKDEKPLFSITGKNVSEHASKLNDGQLAMFKKYPDYRIDVYKTHRTAAAPQSMYDNTIKNATRAKLDGDTATGFAGGIPFPIPKTGAEVMWNNTLKWRGASTSFRVSGYQQLPGKKIQVYEVRLDQQYPPFMKDAKPEQFNDGKAVYQQAIGTFLGPASRVGEGVSSFLALDSADDQAWAYLPGQRRVRKLPSPCCDTPASTTAGLTTMDETQLWLGSLKRFDWKLVGKKEMYIPYNGNAFLRAKSNEELLGDKVYANPDYVRWELHRVWVVDATLRGGERHAAVKSRYYCDEDTWSCQLVDRWDSNGQLWRTFWLSNFVAPDIPAVVPQTWQFHDLLAGVGFLSDLMAGKPASDQYTIKPTYPASAFGPDALVRAGVR
jgi:hypothetical protein